MKLLVGYATTEGQTRKVAQHVADWLVERGHSVELLPLADAEAVGLSRFDRAVLAASVHAGRYQPALVTFLEAERDWLNANPALFLSVSLAAAGHDAEDWRAIEHIVDDLKSATGWTPDEVVHVAGAYRPSQYDLFTRFIMRRIIAEKDPDADPAKDCEYTDWAALDRAVEAWLAT